MHIAGKVAVEWWRASGERSRDRLTNLVQHYGTSYALSDETISALADEAWRQVRPCNTEPMTEG